MTRKLKPNKKADNVSLQKSQFAVVSDEAADNAVPQSEAIDADNPNSQQDNESVSETGEKPIIVCEELVKIYKTKEIEMFALQGLDLTINQGELMAIMGNSGSGKSTLLNMIGGLDTASAGKIFVDGKNMQSLTKSQLLKFKRETVGFVWQNNARNLIPYLSAKDNIELPCRLSHIKPKYSSSELLEMVELSNQKDSKLFEMSGGQQQRIAIAIALVNNPKILLADEPTGAVDTKTTKQILDLFNRVNRELGTTIVIVTHDNIIKRLVNRVVSIQDGKISTESIRKSYAAELENLDDDFGISNTHEEFSVVDKAGRVPIPQSFLQEMGVKNNEKIKVEISDGKVVLTKIE